MPPDVLAVIRQYWGFDRLRPLQAEAIDAALRGRDALVVLPTGGGKSLCYQVPAAVAGRTDVVVSPLISLMKDQVDGLKACGYPAAAIHSGMSGAERREVERGLLAGRYRLLFVAPERLQHEGLLGMLARLNVRAFAIDEAHCISHWGHDFRPEYRQLAGLRARFPQAAFQAYTATATQRVRADIIAQLHLREPAVLVGVFDRPNLVYRVQPKQDVFRQTADVLKRHERQAAIVYCLSRNDTEDMVEFLRGRKFRAEHYHAGLSADQRHRTQEAFANEELDVVVATVAFGMGIDRSDVRCIVHAAVPKSIEHYQQETGRAGRDGLSAECVLFYSYGDVAKWEGLIEKSAAEAGAGPEVVAAGCELLRHIQGYASGTACRHAALSEYFGQKYSAASCGACDVCLGEIEGLTDATVTAQKILSCVARVEQKFGVGHVADVLLGSGGARVRQWRHHELSTYGLLKDMDKGTVQSLIHQLLDQQVLARELVEMKGTPVPILKLNAASWEVLRGQRRVRLREAPVQVKAAQVERDEWDGVERALFEELRGLRAEIARERGTAPFIILHDTVLRDLAQYRPTTDAGLAQTRGFGKQKLTAFGERILNCIRAYCREHGTGSDLLEVNDSPALRPRKNATARVSERRRERAAGLFQRGTAVAAVARELGLAPSTVWGYLERYVAEHAPRDVSAWVDAATYARVSDALRGAGEGAALRPIFEQLGGAVPYEVIRIVAQHRAVCEPRSRGGVQDPGARP